MSDQEYPLPPATFEFLILSLKTQTEMHLGLLHFGEERTGPSPTFPSRATPSICWRCCRKRLAATVAWRSSGW